MQKLIQALPNLAKILVSGQFPLQLPSPARLLFWLAHKHALLILLPLPCSQRQQNIIPLFLYQETEHKITTYHGLQGPLGFAFCFSLQLHRKPFSLTLSSVPCTGKYIHPYPDCCVECSVLSIFRAWLAPSHP